MDDEMLVSRIVDAEQRARESVSAQEEKLANLNTTLREEAQQLRQTYLERARHHLEETEEQEGRNADAEIARLEEQLARDLQQVEELFERRGDEFVARMTQQVLGENP